MSITIIYAHPETEGHCFSVLQSVKNYLKKKKIEANILDLYKIKYDPVMSKDELYTAGGTSVSEQNIKIQQLINESKKLIFIYPTWHYGVPAILKGFIDRVFTPGFAFKYENGMPQGLLNKKGLIFTTTGGPSFVYNFLIRAPKVYLRNVLKFFEIIAKPILIGDCRQITDKKRKEIDELVVKELEKF